jgi:hypothetical protein
VLCFAVLQVAQHDLSSAWLTLNRTVLLPRAACPAISTLMSPHALTSLRASVDGGRGVMATPVRATVSSLRACAVDLHYRVLTSILSAALVARVELSYSIPSAGVAEYNSHFLWPSVDLSFDWLLEPVSPMSAMQVSVWAPRARADGVSHSPVSWMPSWPHHASLMESRAPRCSRSHRQPPNTIATSSMRYPLPLQVQYAHINGGSAVAGVFGHAQSNGTRIEWLRVHVLVQAVTWQHTQDLLTDLNPDLSHALNILGEVRNADDPDNSSVSVAGLSVVDLALARTVSSPSGRSPSPEEHTWCWALYKSEPGVCVWV